MVTFTCSVAIDQIPEYRISDAFASLAKFIQPRLLPQPAPLRPAFPHPSPRPLPQAPQTDRFVLLPRVLLLRAPILQPLRASALPSPRRPGPARVPISRLSARVCAAPFPAPVLAR